MSRWAHLASNQGPTGYEPGALPTELWAHLSREPFAPGAWDLSYRINGQAKLNKKTFGQPTPCRGMEFLPASGMFSEVS